MNKLRWQYIILCIAGIIWVWFVLWILYARLPLISRLLYSANTVRVLRSLKVYLQLSQQIVQISYCSFLLQNSFQCLCFGSSSPCDYGIVQVGFKQHTVYRFGCVKITYLLYSSYYIGRWAKYCAQMDVWFESSFWLTNMLRYLFSLLFSFRCSYRKQWSLFELCSFHIGLVPLYVAYQS